MEIVERQPETKFLDTKEGSALEYFRDYLGGNSGWFFKIVERLSEDWSGNDLGSAGMLIREGEQPVLLIGGACLGCQNTEAEKLNLDTQDIVRVVRKFFSIKENGGKGEIITFSFYIEGRGLFSGSYSVDAVKAGLTLKFLSKGYPKIENMGYGKDYLDLLGGITKSRKYLTPFGERPVEIIKTKGLTIHAGSPNGGAAEAVAAEVNYLLEKTNILMHTYETQIEYRYHHQYLGVLRQYEIGLDISGRTMQEIAIKIRKSIVENRVGVVVFGKILSPELIKEAALAANDGRHVILLMPETSMDGVLSKLDSAMAGEEHLLAETLKVILIHSVGIDGKTKKQDELIINSDHREQIKRNKIKKIVKK